MKRYLYCGTYDDSASSGIYRITFEDGILSDPQRIAALASAKYLAEDGDKIISIITENGKAGIAVLDRQGRRENTLLYEDIASCYVTADEGHIYSANYHEGTMSVIRKDEAGLQLERRIKLADKAGCHQILLKDGLIWLIALFLDKIFIFDKNYQIIREIGFPKGTGPRHAVFSKDGKYLYVLSELSNELFTLNTQNYQIISSTALVHKGAPAAIRLSDENIFISVRKADEIAVYGLDNGIPVFRKIMSCGGRHPRDMITVDGYCICANLDSDEVSCVNEKGIISKVEIPKAVSIICESN